MTIIGDRVECHPRKSTATCTCAEGYRRILTVELGIGGLGYATEIGAGASAVVYRARQIELDREVAVANERVATSAKLLRDQQAFVDLPGVDLTIVCSRSLLPVRSQVFIGPLPLMSMVPRGWRW